MTLRKEKTSNPIVPAIQRLMKIAGPQRTWFYVTLMVDLLLAAIVVLNSAFMRGLFDGVQAKQPDKFWLFIGLILGFAVPGVLFSFLRTWSIGIFSERTLAKIRQAIASQSTALPVSYLEERHSGDLLSVLNADLGKVKTLLATNLLDIYAQTIRGIGAFAYILSINWVLTLVSTLMTPAVFVLISILTKPVTRRSEEMQDEIGQVNSVAQDSIAGAMVVKSFNLADILDQRFHIANNKALKRGMGIAWYWSLINGLGFGLGVTPFIIALGLGGYLVIDGQMTFGSLFAFINLLNFVVNPIGSLPGLIAGISEAVGAAQRVFKLLDHPIERGDGSIIQPEKDIKEVIRFNTVGYRYANGNPVLENINFDIHKGEKVAIVGPSGGGKSTILKLILGYYGLPNDQIYFFGEDQNHWQLAQARQQMAFVSQDTYLFPVSIGENIRCGKLAAGQEEIERAARLANIHDFIISLPDGYNTPAGEWGARLSGGQKQRISLARAILKDAPILLLDEPTSALDAESESLIQDALDRFTKDRTTIVVAHRLSTIKNVDRVLVLQDGQIVEEGSHESLMSRGGLYLDLYKRQFAAECSELLSEE